jgi:uncharacterized membrane protein YraQ (UPF0718 family)
MSRALLVCAALILALFAPGLELGPWHERVVTYLHGLLLEAFPWLLLGALLAALTEEFLPDALLPNLARRLGRAAIPGTALASPLLPMCECGIVAVVRGFIAKGLPAHLCITFLLAAPILNPIVLATTWMAFQDWRMVALRAACGFTIACLAGMIAARCGAGAVLANPPAFGLAGVRVSLGQARLLSQPLPGLPTHAVRAVLPAERPDRIGSIARRTLGHTLDIAAVFILGALLASLAKTSIPPEVIANTGGHYVAGPAMGGFLAIALSICAETDAFLAATFAGMAPHAILCFLVVGPLLDLKLLMMYQGVLRRRAILALAFGIPLTAWVLALVAGLAW